MKLGKKKNEVVKAKPTDVVPTQTRDVNIQEIKTMNGSSKLSISLTKSLCCCFALFNVSIILSILMTVFTLKAFQHQVLYEV